IGAGSAIAIQWNAASWFRATTQTDRSAVAAADDAAGNSTFSDTEPREVSALAYIEPAAGVINVTSPLIGERIVRILVEEGQPVKAGDQLVQLDETFLTLQRDLAREGLAEAERRLEAERSLAKTRLEAAEIAVEQAAEGMAAQRKAQQTQIESLQKNRAQVQVDQERIRTLVERDDPLAPPQQLEHQELRLAQADAEISAAEAALARLDQTTRFQQQTAAAEENVARAGLDAVEKSNPTGTLAKQLEIAEQRLSLTNIFASTNSVVLKVFAHAGEFLAQKPLMQLAQLNEMTCVAEVFDGDIKHVSVDQRTEIRSRAFTGDYKTTFVTGSVKRIGNMVKTPELKRLDPYAPVDRHVIEVRIQLDDVDEAARLVNESATALVNLQVEVTFLVERP
ncbi:MAG: biotin/lipoyl-binding protein, partial [Pirellulaceae bacterium]